ncbi:MAG: hypothetical protein DSY66_01660 [Persephonella sp.]|nr:MAG: hypothetical protein DSY66_01660 [Persephonella sp.]
MLDFILILLFVYLLIFGFYYGLFANIVRFIGIILGIYMSMLFFKPIAHFINGYLKLNTTIVEILTAFVIFLIFFFISLTVKILVKDKVEENPKFRFIDRIIGGFLGIVIYIFILFALVKYSSEYEILNELTSQSDIITLLRDLVKAPYGS